jgi:hypothetical protein
MVGEISETREICSILDIKHGDTTYLSISSTSGRDFASDLAQSHYPHIAGFVLPRKTRRHTRIVQAEVLSLNKQSDGHRVSGPGIARV